MKQSLSEKVKEFEALTDKINQDSDLMLGLIGEVKEYMKANDLKEIKVDGGLIISLDEE